jgi:flavin-binding protein dodecin
VFITGEMFFDVLPSPSLRVSGHRTFLLTRVATVVNSEQAKSLARNFKEVYVDGSVYKIIEVVGTSTISLEDAARNAVETAAKSLDDLRIAEVVKQDMTIDHHGKVTGFRVRLALSFKYHGDRD